jgi:hypothetical protein
MAVLEEVLFVFRVKKTKKFALGLPGCKYGGRTLLRNIKNDLPVGSALTSKKI